MKTRSPKVLLQHNILLSLHKTYTIFFLIEHILAEILQQKDRPRALTFDPNQHKVLNSELKHLYTAVTRARVNVWIFDEDMDKRAPMFEYFKARHLVKAISSDDVQNCKLQ